MSSGRPSRAEVADAMARMRLAISEHGWVITGTDEAARCSDPTCTGGVHGPFLYTVGLTEAGLPELLMEHDSTAITAVVLDRLARQSLAAELVTGARLKADGVFGWSFTVAPASLEKRRRCYAARTLYQERISVLEVTAIWGGDE